MFLAGIAFSAMTVLAATISISTNFEDGVTQYLKKLVILKNDNTTWMVLDWDTLNGENIYGTNITWTNIHWSSVYGNTLSGNNIKGTNITWSKIYGQRGLFSKYCDENESNCSSIDDLKLWSKYNENIYYTGGNVWIWTSNPTEKLVVNGTGNFSGNIFAKNGYFSGIETSWTGEFYTISGIRAKINTLLIENRISYFFHQYPWGDLVNSFHSDKPILFDGNTVWIGSWLIVKQGLSVWEPDNLYLTVSANGVSAKTGYFNEVDVSDGTVSAKKGSFSGASFGSKLGLSSIENIGWKISYTWQLQIMSWSTNTIQIDTSWNVWIGDITPNAKLHVNGWLMLREDSCENNNDVWKLSLIHLIWNSTKYLSICWYSWDSQQDFGRIPIVIVSWSGWWIIFPWQDVYHAAVNEFYGHHTM
jgi:hypothetical protein